MACQRDAPGRPSLRFMLAAAALAGGALAGYGAAAAQETVYVGGSGQTPVVVNLGVLDTVGMPFRRVYLLDPPGTAPRSIFLLQESPAAAAVTTVPALPEPAPELEPLLAPTLTFEAAPSPPVPEPQPVVAAEPAPLPEPTVTLEPAPEPATTLTFEPPALPESLPEPEPLPEPASVPEPAAVTTAALPEPVAAPEPAAAPEPEAELAALPPADVPEPGKMLRIEFDGDAADLPAGAGANLRSIADQLLRNDTLRAQVKAYAGSSSGSASAARRLSLSRALAVRSVLIEQGVRSTRIDVRALGDRNEGGPPERVDVLLVNP